MDAFPPDPNFWIPKTEFKTRSRRSDEDMKKKLATMSGGEMMMVIQNYMKDSRVTDAAKQLMTSFVEDVLGQRDKFPADNPCEAADSSKQLVISQLSIYCAKGKPAYLYYPAGKPAACLAGKPAAFVPGKAIENAALKAESASELIDVTIKAIERDRHAPWRGKQVVHWIDNNTIQLRVAKMMMEDQTPAADFAAEETQETLAHHAAEANNLIQKVYVQAKMICCSEARAALSLAIKEVRDVIVLRCRLCCDDQKDRNEFLRKADRAYSGELMRRSRESCDNKAQLLLAYHKDKDFGHLGFVSMNQLLTEQRGAPRPRQAGRSRLGQPIQAPRAEPEDLLSCGILFA